MKRAATLLLALLLSLSLILPAGAEATAAAQAAYKITLKAGQAAANAKAAPREMEAEATLGVLDGMPFITLASPFNKPLALCYTAGEGALLYDIEKNAWHRLTYQGTSFSLADRSAALKEQTGYDYETLVQMISSDMALLFQKLKQYAEEVSRAPSVALLLQKLQTFDGGTFSLSWSLVKARF